MKGYGSQDAAFWYDWDCVPSYEVHKSVWSHVEGVEREQRDIHSNNVEYARLYANREEPGLCQGLRSRHREADLVTENVIQSVVDTATSLIGKSRPKIRILTDNADWSLQQTAKRLEKYLWGLFQALRIHELLTTIFRDACIFGSGVLKLYSRKGKICAERVLIDEIVVDESECPHGGMPRQMHHIRLVAKETLVHLYGESYREAIEKSSTALRGEYAGFRPVDPGMVAVLEGWHPGPEGRHYICTSEVTFVDEPYEEEWYPLVFYHWSPPLTGFYGQGLAESLLGFQIRLNELNDFIQKCQDLIAVPRVALDAGSKVLKPHLDNEIGAIIPYVGKPPVFFTPTALNSEIYAYKEQLKQAAFEFAGISKMAAQATRPEGIDAAVAIRELSDNQSQRFSVQQQRFEDAAIQVAELICRLCAKMYKGKGTPPKVFMAEKFVETIDWPEVDLDEKRFVLSVQAASIMSETPSGRLQRVIELAQYGVQLDQAELRRLLGHPDIGLADSRATSKLEDAEWVVDQLSRGEFPQPEPQQDIQLCIERVTAAYLDAKRGGAPESILEGFRQWPLLASKLMEPKPEPTMGPQLPPEQMPMDPSMGGMPPGQPTPLLPPSAALDAGALPGLLIPPNQQPGF